MLRQRISYLFADFVRRFMLRPSMGSSLIGVLLCIVFLCCGSTPAIAQSSPDSSPTGSITISGNIRERYEVWDWFPTNGESTYGYSGTLIRMAFSQQRKHYDWTIELAAPVLLDLPDGAVEPPPQGQLGLGATYYAANRNKQYAAFIFPKQAFVRFNVAHSSLQLGRFEFTDGSEVTPKDATLAALKTDRIGQRLIGTFGFSDVMRSFDGLHYAYSNGPWNFTAVGAIPTRGVFQVDGWGWVKTPLTYVSLTRQSAFGRSHVEWRIFGIYYNDDRGILKTDNRPLAVRNQDFAGIDIGTYGGHYIVAIPTAAGPVDLLGWGALQSGRWGVLTQRSGAGALEGGIQPHFASRLRPWFRAGYFYSSGDKDPSDGVHGTFFAVLPTPRVYARFPFFNEMNNRDLFAELILRPRDDLTFRTDVHGLWLASNHDLWYSGGGAFQPWTFGFSGRPSNNATGLANLYDISFDYKWTRSVSLGLYFGYAQGHRVIESIYPGDSNGMLGFVEVNYHF
jgi:hypothetical protein